MGFRSILMVQKSPKLLYQSMIIGIDCAFLVIENINSTIPFRYIELLRACCNYTTLAPLSKMQKSIGLIKCRFRRFASLFFYIYEISFCKFIIACSIEQTFDRLSWHVWDNVNRYCHL